MLDDLKQKLCNSINYLKAEGLRNIPKGNISVIDRANGLVVIEAENYFCDDLSENAIVCDLGANIVEGEKKQSSDLPAHLEIYKAFPKVNAIVHTHSEFVTGWAQAGRDIPVYGTTHADFFSGNIPCTRIMTGSELKNEYEANMGAVIAETFSKFSLDENSVCAATVFNHGAFVWGRDLKSATENALILEYIAKTAYITEKLNPDIITLNKGFLEKRKKYN